MVPLPVSEVGTPAQGDYLLLASPLLNTPPSPVVASRGTSSVPHLSLPLSLSLLLPHSLSETHTRDAQIVEGNSVRRRLQALEASRPASGSAMAATATPPHQAVSLAVSGGTAGVLSETLRPALGCALDGCVTPTI